jgi:bifunctional non-homologous end joining protein LigD
MLATIGSHVPTDSGWMFEQKYDGMRVIASVDARRVRLVTRNGRDKAKQFPEIVDALRGVARRAGRSVVLDGEIVAVARGNAAPFQALQPRMQLTNAHEISRLAAESPARFVAFDVLRDGRETLMPLPMHERRQRLERLLRKSSDKRIDISEGSPSAKRMLGRAKRNGWEGVIAKRLDDPYRPGSRSRSWLKLKLQHRAELVVGGYTEPRRSRELIGALLLGYYDERGALCYAGHMGGGFGRESLRDVYRRLRPLVRSTIPFEDRVRTNEPAHWVRPSLVVEVKFSEWTADGKLRQPIFMGVRDDKAARDVHRERESIQEWAQEIGRVATARRVRKVGKRTRRAKSARSTNPVVAQLDEIQSTGGNGVLELGRGATLQVSNLDKLYFPQDGFSKGDLMRYYASTASVILPVIKDRPLILKRYPNGIEGPSFFQQNAPKVPPGVRTARVLTDGKGRAERIIGGDLPTLLYTVQIGSIAVHTWQARTRTHRFADTTTIDLDPGDGVPFSQVVGLAKDIKVEMDRAGLRGVAKTSGSRGIHIVLPLPARTTFAVAAAVAQRLAERVTARHAEIATLARSIRARPKGSIYVDAQQNAEGKSVVAAYSVRARRGATVSAPLEWSELRRTLRLEAFTIETMPVRLRRMGDIWGAAMKRRNTKRVLDRLLRGE